MKFRYFIAALFLALAVGCVQEEIGTLSEIQVSPSYVTIDVNGGSSSLTITANDAWQVVTSTIPEWLTVSPTSGSAGESQILFSAEATTATNNAEIQITCGGQTQYVNVIQYAAPAEPDIISVAEAIELVRTRIIAGGEPSVPAVYIRGIVCKIDEISTSYGNATYYLSDDGTFSGSYSSDGTGDGNWFEVYRGYWLDGAKFTSGDEFSVGDELVVLGDVISYKGTPETNQGTAQVYSITKSPIKVEAFDFEMLPCVDTTFNMVVTADESPLLVSSDAAWLQIADVNSDGSYKLHADENLYTASRTANISIKGPSAVKSVEITQAGVPATGATITDIIAAEDGSGVQTLPSSVVVALTTKGAVLSDGTSAIYAYGDAAAALKIGDAVRMSAVKTTYNGVPELKDIESVFVDSEGNEVSYPNATDITADIENYAASTAEYVKLSGTLAVSGNYYNITLDNVDASVKQGSIANPIDELDAKSFDGKKITVTGYFNGISGKGKYVNVIATKIDEYVDNPKGTLTNPYTPSEISAALLDGKTFDEDVYIKGKVSSILYTFSANYGTATFWISDDGTAYGVSEDKKSTSDPAHDFECYGTYWMGNQKWADGNAQLSVGDEVVVCGKTTVYNGVAETANKKAYVYSVNMATTDANGIGSIDYPFNIAGIHSYIDSAEALKAAAKEAGENAPTFPDVCVKGKVSAVLYTFSASYGTGTFWISDDGTAHGIADDKKSTSDTVNDFECYSVYYLGGNAWVEGNDQIAEGDEVIVKGQYTIYKGTYETSSKKAWIYSHNGKTE